MEYENSLYVRRRDVGVTFAWIKTDCSSKNQTTRGIFYCKNKNLSIWKWQSNSFARFINLLSVADDERYTYLFLSIKETIFHTPPLNSRPTLQRYNDNRKYCEMFRSSPHANLSWAPTVDISFQKSERAIFFFLLFFCRRQYLSDFLLFRIFPKGKTNSQFLNTYLISIGFFFFLLCF